MPLEVNWGRDRGGHWADHTSVGLLERKKKRTNVQNHYLQIFLETINVELFIALFLKCEKN